MQACGFVFGGGYEVGSVEGELEVGYLHAVFVGGGVIEAVAGLGVYNMLVWLVDGRGRKGWRCLGGKGYLCVVLAYATVFVPGYYVAA